MKKKSILTATLFLTLTAGLNVQAVEGVLVAHVLRTIVDVANFGRCGVILDQTINTATNSPACPGQFVTFACDGSFGPAEIGFRMLDQAQLAKALGRRVLVQVDDNRTINTFCFARRIDVE